MTDDERGRVSWPPSRVQSELIRDVSDAVCESVDPGDSSSLDNDPFNFDPDQVINPYPITSRSKAPDSGMHSLYGH